MIHLANFNIDVCFPTVLVSFSLMLYCVILRKPLGSNPLGPGDRAF